MNLSTRWRKFLVSRKGNGLVVFEREACGILCGRCNLMLLADLKKREERYGDDMRFGHYLLKPDTRCKSGICAINRYVSSKRRPANTEKSETSEKGNKDDLYLAFELGKKEWKLGFSSS